MSDFRKKLLEEENVYLRKTRATKLNFDQKKQVMDMYEHDVPISLIAERFQVSRPTIYSVIKNTLSLEPRRQNYVSKMACEKELESLNYDRKAKAALRAAVILETKFKEDLNLTDNDTPHASGTSLSLGQTPKLTPVDPENVEHLEAALDKVEENLCLSASQLNVRELKESLLPSTQPNQKGLNVFAWPEAKLKQQPCGLLFSGSNEACAEASGQTKNKCAGLDQSDVMTPKVKQPEDIVAKEEMIRGVYAWNQTIKERKNREEDIRRRDTYFDEESRNLCGLCLHHEGDTNLSVCVTPFKPKYGNRCHKHRVV